MIIAKTVVTGSKYGEMVILDGDREIDSMPNLGFTVDEGGAVFTEFVLTHDEVELVVNENKDTGRIHIIHLNSGLEFVVRRLKHELRFTVHDKEYSVDLLLKEISFYDRGVYSKREFKELPKHARVALKILKMLGEI